MTVFEFASILGLILGPIIGALVAFKLQDRSIIQARRLEDFRTLMRNRRTPLSAEFVSAFNVIEIDYAGEKKVESAFRALFSHFGANPARLMQEELRPEDTPEVRNAKEATYVTRCVEERHRLLTKLLFAMGKALGYNIEQLEILEGGYRPVFHAEIETQNEIYRQFLIALASGKQALPVTIMDPE